MDLLVYFLIFLGGFYIPPFFPSHIAPLLEIKFLLEGRDPVVLGVDYMIRKGGKTEFTYLLLYKEPLIVYLLSLRLYDYIVLYMKYQDNDGIC